MLVKERGQRRGFYVEMNSVLCKIHVQDVLNSVNSSPELKSKFRGNTEVQVVEEPIPVHNSASRAATFCSASELQLGRREILVFSSCGRFSVLRDSTK